MTNDELNKPRQFWLDIATPYGDPCDFIHTEDPHKAAERNNTHCCISATNIHVIEFAPVLKMMEKMAEAISNWKIQVEMYGGYYLPGNYKQLITAHESYKAFKRENGLE